ncbi:MAG: quinone oxidoreductase [Proteobacteria bacterium]|nr:quinone oxidoreductase [Pseudomonadota bacterium]
MHARAVQIEAVGGPEVMQLVDIDVPDPGPGEVRIRHHACGVNLIDTYHRSGLYKIVLPAILGTEGAGVVDAIGPGVEHLAVGDRVAYAARSPGSYATARVVSAIPVVKLPDAIDFHQGAAMMLKGLTVQYLLNRTRVTLAKGDFLVWHAAAGGVGLIACQWARALGLQLIATAGSAAKCELALAHGAAYAIDYSKEDIVTRVREITGGRGVDVVYDSVGKDTWHRSLSCLAPLGLLVSFGNASGPVPPVDLLTLSAKGSLYVTRPTLFTHLATRDAAQAMADDLFAMVASGQIAIDPPRTYRLDDVAQAHRDLEGRVTTGASVLLPE